MKTLQFTSLHGTQLTGRVSDTLKINRERVDIVRMLGKLYAVLNGYSILEMPDNTNMIEFNAEILKELWKIQNIQNMAKPAFIVAI